VVAPSPRPVGDRIRRLGRRGQGLLGQVGASVESWLADQTDAFRDAIRYVALDPSAPYASAVHRLLPRRPNQMVIRMRQRVTQQQLGRSGHRNDTVWANRRMLLRGREQLP
jgi:transposase